MVSKARKSRFDLSLTALLIQIKVTSYSYTKQLVLEFLSEFKSRASSNTDQLIDITDSAKVMVIARLKNKR